MSTIEDNLLDPAVLAAPYGYYAALRTEAPVHLTPFGFWLVSRYDDVMAVVRDHERFSSQAFAMMGASASPEAAAVAAEGYPPANTLLTNDPPSHTRFRALVNKAFAPKRVAEMEPGIRAIARELVAGFAASGSVDLVSQFAVPLPLTVIADALGVDRADMPRFKRWSDDSVAPLSGFLTPERALECARSRVEMQHYMVERIHEREVQARDDLLSDLVHATMDDPDAPEGERRLSVPELLNIIEQLLVAGNETTTKLLAAGMLLLLEHPDQMAKVRQNPDLIPNLVEEALRMESPVQMLPRVAKVDVEIAGTEVPAGSLVFVMYGAANRDDDHFPDAATFDVERPNARTNLAFGQGPHFCVGAALARAEARIGFETLLEQLDGLALAPHEPTERELSMVLRGLTALRLTFDPRQEPS